MNATLVLWSATAQQRVQSNAPVLRAYCAYK